MPRRDTSPGAVAREWWGNHAGEGWHTADALADGFRAERARVRRIVREELARTDAECVAHGDRYATIEDVHNEVYFRAQTDGVRRCGKAILAALREGKGAKR